MRGNNYLKVPNSTEFSKIVKGYEYRYEITECVYKGVLEKFETEKLCYLGRDHVDRILEPYFLGWGLMGRVLGHKGCEVLCEKLKTMSGQLEKFRQEDLLTVDLSKVAREITDIYEEIRDAKWEFKKGKEKRVGPTSTSKALHLVAPNLFMMWDRAIRTHYGFKESGDEYVRFLITMQNWMISLNPMIKEFQNRYKKSSTKIIDEYNWIKSKM